MTLLRERGRSDDNDARAFLLSNTAEECVELLWDRRGVDLISDALPFGRLWYCEPDASQQRNRVVGQFELEDFAER
jgi:hypothetical protein